MRVPFVSLTCLAFFVLSSPVIAKEKEHRQMDAQAMMEAYKELPHPGNRTSNSPL